MALVLLVCGPAQPVMAGPADNSPAVCPGLPTEPAELSAHARKLLDALTSNQDKRFERLRELLAQAPDQPSPGEDWLTQRALLVVAADELNREAFGRARARLREVPTASPAAVGAALLLAESYLLEGKPRQARQWYLRVGERFPRERTALQGVLAAGAGLEAEAPEAAIALYNDVSEKATAAAGKLKDQRAQMIDQPLAFLFNPEGDPALRRQLLKKMARGNNELSVERERQRITHTARLRCLLRKSRPIYQARARLQHRLGRLANQEKAVRATIANLKEQKATLKEQLRPDGMTPEQKQIRKEITAVDNAIQRKKARLKFLERNRERLPRVMDKLDRKIRMLYKHFRKRERLESQAVRKRLTRALDALRQDFLDLAGTARHHRARLMEDRVSRNNGTDG